MARKALPCGTLGGYSRHRLHHEPACDACREVYAQYQAAYDQARRDAALDAMFAEIVAEITGTVNA